MAILKWLCTNSTKNMVVKIVHPGGHRELHDRPVLASEIMHRNPKCVVAYPHVFQQPWAVVAPDTVLMLGHKFYVVPINTIRKLQKRSLKDSRSPLHNIPNSESESESSQKENTETEPKKEGCLCKDKCFMGMLKIIGNKGDNNIASEATGSSSNVGSSETKELAKKKNRDSGSSPNTTLTSCDHWEPGLERICEE